MACKVAEQGAGCCGKCNLDPRVQTAIDRLTGDDKEIAASAARKVLSVGNEDAVNRLIGVAASLNLENFAIAMKNIDSHPDADGAWGEHETIYSLSEGLKATDAAAQGMIGGVLKSGPRVHPGICQR